MTTQEIKRKNDLIMELRFSMDKLEQGLAILKKAGYGQHTDPYKSTVHALNSLRSDIWGLQTGQFPIVRTL